MIDALVANVKAAVSGMDVSTSARNIAVSRTYVAEGQRTYVAEGPIEHYFTYQKETPRCTQNR
jgi:hypothetical protein